MAALSRIAYEPNATPGAFLCYFIIILTFDARQGSDWFAVFNQNIAQRRLDIDLVHTLEHDRCVLLFFST